MLTKVKPSISLDDQKLCKKPINLLCWFAYYVSLFSSTLKLLTISTISNACLIVYRHYLPLPLKVVKIEVAAMAACHTMPKCNHQLAMCRHLHGIRKPCHWSCTSNVHDPLLFIGFYHLAS